MTVLSKPVREGGTYPSDAPQENADETGTEVSDAVRQHIGSGGNGDSTIDLLRQIQKMEGSYFIALPSADGTLVPRRVSEGEISKRIGGTLPRLPELTPDQTRGALDKEKIAFMGIAALSQMNREVARLVLREQYCPVPVQGVVAFFEEVATSMGVSKEEAAHEILGLDAKDTRSIKVLRQEAFQRRLASLQDFSQGLEPFKSLPEQMKNEGIITFISEEEATTELEELKLPLVQAEAPLPKNKKILTFLGISEDHKHYDMMVYDPHFSIEYNLALYLSSVDEMEKLFAASEQIRNQMKSKDKLPDDEKYATYDQLLEIVMKFHYKETLAPFILLVTEALCDHYGKKF